MPDVNQQAVFRIRKKKVVKLGHLFFWDALAVAGFYIGYRFAAGWYFLGAFGVVASLLATYNFLPSCLELTPEGIIYQTAFKRHPLIPWKSVDKFFVVALEPEKAQGRGFKYVGFNYLPGAEKPFTLPSILQTVSEGGFWFELEKPPEELAATLNKFLERAKGVQLHSEADNSEAPLTQLAEEPQDDSSNSDKEL